MRTTDPRRTALLQAAQCPAACEPIDDKGVDYKTLYLQEAEKNKQLLQWIVQLQSNLSVRLQTGGDTAALATWGSEQVSDNTLKAESADTRQQEGVPARGTLREGVKVGDDWKASPELRLRQTGTGGGGPAHTPPSEAQPGEATHACGMDASSGDFGRLVAKTADSSKSSSSSPALTHRRSEPQATGHESMMAPELVMIDLARTTCSKCGQSFAFCSAFLSRHEFLVMPCPKCQTAAAIPPTPLASTHNAISLSGL